MISLGVWFCVVVQMGRSRRARSLVEPCYVPMQQPTTTHTVAPSCFLCSRWCQRANVVPHRISRSVIRHWHWTVMSDGGEKPRVCGVWTDERARTGPVRSKFSGINKPAGSCVWYELYETVCKVLVNTQIVHTHSCRTLKPQKGLTLWIRDFISL